MWWNLECEDTQMKAKKGRSACQVRLATCGWSNDHMTTCCDIARVSLCFRRSLAIELIASERQREYAGDTVIAGNGPVSRKDNR